MSKVQVLIGLGFALFGAGVLSYVAARFVERRFLSKAPKTSTITDACRKYWILDCGHWYPRTGYGIVMIGDAVKCSWCVRDNIRITYFERRSHK